MAAGKWDGDLRVKHKELGERLKEWWRLVLRTGENFS
jgi:hypothetical protein